MHHNVFALYMLQIANYAIPLITLPYLLRVLGADRYGVMAMAYAVVFFMVLFVDAGTNTLAVRRLTRPGLEQARINAIFAATQWLKLAQCIAMAAVLFALTLIVPAIGEVSEIYYATFAIVLGSLLFPTWLFQGLEVMHYTTACSVGGRLLATAGIFLFVKEPQDVVIAALLQACATALSGFLALPIARARIGVRFWVPRHQLLAELRRTLDDARALGPAEFVTGAIGNSGVFILGLFASDAAVGVYAAIEKMARAGACVFQPLTKALFPRMAAGWLAGRQDTAARCMTWTARILLAAGLVALSLALLAPRVLVWLFGDGWAQHAALLRVLALWIVANVGAATVGQLLILARGRRSVFATCLLAGAAVQLFASVFGAAFFGAPGLVVALAASEAFRFALFVFASHLPHRGTPLCAS